MGVVASVPLALLLIAMALAPLWDDWRAWHRWQRMQPRQLSFFLEHS